MMSKQNPLDHNLFDSFIYWKTKPSDKVKLAFLEEFPNGINEKWRVLVTGHCKVSFILNDERLFAIFSSEGKLIRIYSGQR